MQRPSVRVSNAPTNFGTRTWHTAEGNTWEHLGFLSAHAVWDNRNISVSQVTQASWAYSWFCDNPGGPVNWLAGNLAGSHLLRNSPKADSLTGYSFTPQIPWEYARARILQAIRELRPTHNCHLQNPTRAIHHSNPSHPVCHRLGRIGPSLHSELQWIHRNLIYWVGQQRESTRLRAIDRALYRIDLDVMSF